MSSAPLRRPDPPEDHAGQVLEERNRAFRVLYDTVIEVAAGQPGDLLTTLCRNLGRVCQATCCALATFDAETGSLRLDAIESAVSQAPCARAVGAVTTLDPELVERLTRQPIITCSETEKDLFGLFVDCAGGSAGCSVTGTRYRVACRREGRLIAVGTIVLPPGRKLRPRDVVETYLDLVGLTIQRHQTLQALEASERKFRTLVEGASIGVAILRGLRLAYANPWLEALIGSAPAASRTRVLRLIAPEDLPRTRELARGLGPGQRIADGFALHLRRAEGGLADVEVGGVPIVYQGRPAFLLFVQDVTARNTLQTELARVARLESINVLAAGVAHEINTPLQYVRDNVLFLETAFADLKVFMEQCARMAQAGSEERAAAPAPNLCLLAKEAGLDTLVDEVPGAVRQVLEGLEHMHDIVKAMKTLAHPDNDDYVASDLNEIVKDCIVFTQSEWRPVAVVEVEYDPALPDVVCQPGAMHQVVLHLLINAAQAIAARGLPAPGLIGVRTRRAEDEVLIEIRDTGEGIAPENAARIFDPFFTTRPVGSGRGQGLALANSVVVDRHGGHLSYESQVGRGTAFSVRLPLVPPAVVLSLRPQPLPRSA